MPSGSSWQPSQSRRRLEIFIISGKYAEMPFLKPQACRPLSFSEILLNLLYSTLSIAYSRGRRCAERTLKALTRGVWERIRTHIVFCCLFLRLSFSFVFAQAGPQAFGLFSSFSSDFPGSFVYACPKARSRFVDCSGSVAGYPRRSSGMRSV